MESYRDFARVYDEFMDQTPYDEWLLNILNIFKEYKIDKDAQVLDLAADWDRLHSSVVHLRISGCFRGTSHLGGSGDFPDEPDQRRPVCRHKSDFCRSRVSGSGADYICD